MMRILALLVFPVMERTVFIGMVIAAEDTEFAVNIFHASTDCLWAASYQVNNHPWYWKDGVVGGEKVERLPDTTNEQCFYAVLIDRDAKLVKIVAVGVDHDWEFNYG